MLSSNASFAWQVVAGGDRQCVNRLGKGYSVSTCTFCRLLVEPAQGTAWQVTVFGVQDVPTSKGHAHDVRLMPAQVIHEGLHISCHDARFVRRQVLWDGATTDAPVVKSAAPASTTAHADSHHGLLSAAQHTDLCHS